MFGVGAATRIYLAPGSTDMRKGANRPHGLVRDQLQCDPLSGHLFLFSGSVAEFVGRNAVENAATWKSPKTGLSHTAWKSCNRGGIPTLFHRLGRDVNLSISSQQEE